MPILLGIGLAGAAAGTTRSHVRAAPARLQHGARSSGNSVTFQDSTGENGSAPDITAVTAANDDAGMLTFDIHIPNRTQLTDDEVSIFFDTNNNDTDGAGQDFEGSELVLDFLHNSVDLARWNGSKFDFSGGSPSSLSYAWTNSTLTVRVKASDLGLGTSFRFYVAAFASVSDPNSHALDYAPDAGHGTWSYDVKISPPAATPAPTPVAKPKPKVPKCKKGQKSTAKHRCHK